MTIDGSDMEVEVMVGSNRNNPYAVTYIGVPVEALHNNLSIIPADLVTDRVKANFQCGASFTRKEVTPSRSRISALAQWLPGDDTDDAFYIVVIPVSLPVFFQDKVTSGPMDNNTENDLGTNWSDSVVRVFLEAVDGCDAGATTWILKNHNKLGDKFTLPDKNRRPIVSTMHLTFHRLSDEQETELKGDMNDLDDRLIQFRPNQPPPRTNATHVTNSSAIPNNIDVNDIQDGDNEVKEFEERAARFALFTGKPLVTQYSLCPIPSRYSSLVTGTVSEDGKFETATFRPEARTLLRNKVTATFNKHYKSSHYQQAVALSQGDQKTLSRVDPAIQYPASNALSANCVLRQTPLESLSDGRDLDGACVAYEVPTSTDNGADSSVSVSKAVEIEKLMGETDKNTSKMSKSIGIDERVDTLDAALTFLGNVG